MRDREGADEVLAPFTLRWPPCSNCCRNSRTAPSLPTPPRPTRPYLCVVALGLLPWLVLPLLPSAFDDDPEELLPLGEDIAVTAVTKSRVHDHHDRVPVLVVGANQEQFRHDADILEA